MPEEKKTETTVPTRVDLAKKLNDITFKNHQIQMVTDLQNENAKLKDMVGRRKSGGGSSAGRISGLRGLEGNLGRQFQKRGVDY